MTYFKYLSSNYITAIGTGSGGIEISKSEYDTIMAAIKSRPSVAGKGYHLKTNLTWEEYDLPSDPEPSDDDELAPEETLSILLGGVQ